ncbi:MAG: Pvc16 family protein, partial [Pseudomonadota bacterium]
MSNALALATVSSALRRRVVSAAVSAVADAKVRLGTPTAKLAEDNDALVNIHLYRIEPNAAHANTHFPTRSGKGQTLGPARLALDLHYIFSFYGDAETFVPERIMAKVMLALENIPLLTSDTIAAAIADNDDELSESDLAAVDLRAPQSCQSDLRANR